MAEWSRVPSRVRDLLDPVGKRLGLEGATDSGGLFARWADIVGDEIAAHVEPTSLRDGVLRVRTDSPAWATELAYLAADISARVNSAMGKELVRELKVSTGPPSDRKGADRPPQARRAMAASEEPNPDPRAAFEKARRAWEVQHQKRGPDQEFC